MNKFIFRYRGWLFIPSALLMFILARPTLTSMILGLSIAFLVGEGIRIWAVGYSGVTTRKGELEAPQLITAGPYALVRNPLYFGNLISWLGFCVAASGGAPWWAKITIFAGVIISYWIIYGHIIPYEEQFLAKEFGEPFQEYLKKVPRMIPTLKPYEKQNGKWDPGVILIAESQTILMLVGVSVILTLKFLRILPF